MPKSNSLRSERSRAVWLNKKDPDSRDDYRYSRWKKSVKERDNFTCRICGKTRLEASDCHSHHMYPYNHFEKLRYDIDNGLTLCSSCHFKLEQEILRRVFEYVKNQGGLEQICRETHQEYLSKVFLLDLVEKSNIPAVDTQMFDISYYYPELEDIKIKQSLKRVCYRCFTSFIPENNKEQVFCSKKCSSKDKIAVQWSTENSNIKDLTWITDGKNSTRIKESNSIPEGWEFGRAVYHLKTRFIWITDGIESRRILEVDNIPDGWSRGRTVEVSPSFNNREKIWITDGKSNKMIQNNLEVPKGWKRGKIHKKNLAQKILLSH
jgi:hypothetical protein